MARSLVINSQLQIPGSELTLSFVRSSGPGGQNVNKVNSKAVLRWNVAASSSLADDVKARFQRKFSQRINQQGEIVLASDRHRDQPQNVADCYEKLRQFVLIALRPPQPRKATRPTRGSIERRLQHKQKTSTRKQQRRFRPGNDD